MHVTSPVQQTSSEYGQIEILHYINIIKKKDDLNTVVYYFTRALHPSDQHVPHYINIITHILGKLKLHSHVIWWNIIIYMSKGEITISFKLHVIINETNITLLLEYHY